MQANARELQPSQRRAAIPSTAMKSFGALDKQPAFK
jgi:hypothetical protein